MSLAAVSYGLLLLWATGTPVTDPSHPMRYFGVGQDDDAVAALNTPTVLFINFDGPFMNGGCGNDSRMDCSTLFPNVQFDPYPGDQGMRASVVQAARADVLDFGVIVVGERPTQGDYAMVVVGEPAGGAPANVGGVAPTIDCGNTFPNLTSFAFNVGSGPNGISTVVHQEAAHTWGLEHVDDNSDNLFPSTSGAQDKKYTDECHRVVSNTDLDPTFSGCNSIHTMFCEENFQNSYQEMLLLFGPPIADTVAPSVSIDAPSDGQVLQFDEDFDLVITLDDDRRPQALETLIFFDDVESAEALLPDDTHAFPVGGGPAPDGHGLGDGEHRIRVEIVDEAGNPAVDEITFVIEGAPAGGEESSDEGGSGEGSSEGAEDSGGDDDDADTDVVPQQPRGEDGCGCVSSGSAPAGWMWLALLFGLRRRSASIATAGLLACAPTPSSTTSPPDTEAPRPEAPSSKFTVEGLANGAVLLPDLGTHKLDVNASDDAQRWFDQGLALTYGFNHDEAARSFAKGAALDPKCAMCLWGVAYTLGPNYNIPLLPDRSAGAHDAVTRAKAIAEAPVERALVDALAQRYKGPEWIDPAAQQPFNEAYARAMKDVAAKFPEDVDVQVLYAEALMNVNPWKLWTPAGKAAPGTAEILATLEGALQRAPDHPGANHYWIHAVEASPDPSRGLPMAKKLASLVPGAGHVVHMPAHIYQRVGLYAEASQANRDAVAVDRKYLETMEPLGYYGFYLAHNFGFLAYSASMQGRRQESLEAARYSAENMPMDLVCGMPGMDFFVSEPLLVMVRFGRWEEILAAPRPAAKHQVLTALWHHARGMALASTDKIDEARAELDALKTIAADIPEDLLAGLNQGRLVLELAAKTMEARIAEREKKEDAIALWEQAVAIEDRLAYNEPADWFYPTRHYLGAALLDAKRPKDAIAVFEEDLRRNPKNGWATFGMWQAHVASKKPRQAASWKAAFEAAWRDADVKLERAAY